VFASKRTSAAEARYKPFLLEFVALKFAMDKFDSIIWGFLVEIETDCQALWDVIMSDDLNATHSHWLNGILTHQIVDAQHIPGWINLVGDGLSRMKASHIKKTTEAHGWLSQTGKRLAGSIMTYSQSMKRSQPFTATCVTDLRTNTSSWKSLTHCLGSWWPQLKGSTNELCVALKGTLLRMVNSGG
jgi:hypothetical protein